MKQLQWNRRILSLTLGIVYLWFGSLKFFPGLSPAEELAKITINHLSLNLISQDVAILLLAILEVGIGIGLITGVYGKIAAKVAMGHLLFTFTPLFLFPGQSFEVVPIAPTLLGQYIGKNLVFAGALATILWDGNPTLKMKKTEI